MSEYIIKAISYRKILNSHVEFTNESPTYNINTEEIIEMINSDLCCDIQLNQKYFDDYLEGKMQIFGRNKLLTKTKIIVNNNLVNKFDKADNCECIELLLSIRDSLNLTDSMI